jgi:hypothetical protein
MLLLLLLVWHAVEPAGSFSSSSIDLALRKLFLELEGGSVIVKEGRRSLPDLAGLCMTLLLLLMLLLRFDACPLLLSDAIEAIASFMA